MDTRRLILVLIFTFSSFMLWENWQKHNQPKPAPTEVAAAKSATGAPTPSASLQAGTVTAAAGVTPAVTASNTAETFTVTTDRVKATISLQGGDLVGLELLKYKQHDNKDKNFLLLDAKHQYVVQSGLIADGLPSHRSQFRRMPARPSSTKAAMN